jgi:uncharacterized protein (UPF0332 family)
LGTLVVFDWSGFADLAQELAQRSGDEAAERSAISRAYYAAFHTARDYLDKTGPPVARSGSAHVEVRNRMLWSERQVGEGLRRLHGLRKHADYDDLYPDDLSADAAFAVALSQTLINAIDKLT